MGQSTSATATSQVEKTKQRVYTFQRHIGLDGFSLAITIIAAFAFAITFTASILYCILIDRHQAFFNHAPNNSNVTSYNISLIFTVGTYLLGLVILMICVIINRGDQIATQYGLIPIWLGGILFIMIPIVGTYIIILVGIVNTHCEKYGICCADSTVPIGTACPSNSVLSLWLGVLATMSIGYGLGLLSLGLAYWHSFWPSGKKTTGSS
jgi:hypothetical protein